MDYCSSKENILLSLNHYILLYYLSTKLIITKSHLPSFLSFPLQEIIRIFAFLDVLDHFRHLIKCSIHAFTELDSSL